MIPPGHGNGLNMFNKKTGEFKHFVHEKSDKNYNLFKYD